jgi:lipoyl(octanoyl) transferase
VSANRAAQVPLRRQWLGLVDYQRAWALQQRLAVARGQGLIDDCVLLLEHPPVYTVGRNGRAEHLRRGAAHLRSLGATYCDVDRGGSVTFHGPGQLVAYPVVLLADVFPIAGHPQHGDVVRYLHALEDALIATALTVGVTAVRRPPYTGAWVGTDKLAAIGVKLAHGVTTHGIALNVTTDLDWFAHIVPCGIDDGGVTSLERHGVDGVTAESIAPQFAGHLADALGRRLEAADDQLTLLTGARSAATTAG